MGIVITRLHRQLITAHLGRIRDTVSRRLGGSRHEHRVLQIAVGLFDLTLHHHRLESRHRYLLQLAALLHDIGRAQGSARHHTHGARILMEDPSIELRPEERGVLAFLTQYHRGDAPDLRSDWAHPQIESPRTMHFLLSILRTADALDSRHFTTPALTIGIKGDRLRIRCYVEDVREAEEALLRKKKHRMLEELLNLRMDVQVRHIDSAEIAW